MRSKERKKKELEKQQHLTVKLLLVLAILDIIDKLLELLIKLTTK